MGPHRPLRRMLCHRRACRQIGSRMPLVVVGQWLWLGLRLKDWRSWFGLHRGSLRYVGLRWRQVHLAHRAVASRRNANGFACPCNHFEGAADCSSTVTAWSWPFLRGCKRVIVFLTFDIAQILYNTSLPDYFEIYRKIFGSPYLRSVDAWYFRQQILLPLKRWGRCATVLMPQNIPWRTRPDQPIGANTLCPHPALLPAVLVAGFIFFICSFCSSWDGHLGHALSLVANHLPQTSSHPTQALPPLTMAPAQPRPYRRILTSALHRRFVHASALSLLICYAIAIAIGDKSSCECREASLRATSLFFWPS